MASVDVVPTDEALAIVVARARRIPDRYRTFTESRESARRLHRMPDELLDRLLALGFPHGTDGTEPTFYTNDLRNACEELGLPSPQRSAIMLMGAALEAGARETVVRRTVDLHARCPAPGHDGDCGFTLAPSLASNNRVTRFTPMSAAHCRLTVELPGGRVSQFTGAHRELLAELDDVHFARLPHALADDPGFLRDAKLADCQSGARFLVERAASYGVSARMAFGILLTQPFSNTHAWAELDVGGEWLVADPLSLAVLARWGVLDPAAWPPCRSPHGSHWKLGEGVEALVRHGGRPAPVSLITRHG
ncbi:transglutaminase domain-containing protein [Micromonospora sp. ATCC 39149]|uniref:Transglutaminase domain-containing protein n=1 Tax=Micromonospora carbonacea TaxID=47853 RepID=A0A7D5Y5N2_9ACTN|nr:transglutaminase domain-containing protein [Micromonospora sp. ATCC 39149]QLJ97712.1 transglutaminase domain-containing protein [Micromonospora carbonacea]